MLDFDIVGSVEAGPGFFCLADSRGQVVDSAESRRSQAAVMAKHASSIILMLALCAIVPGVAASEPPTPGHQRYMDVPSIQPKIEREG